ncbi:hypothetical protein N9Y48_00205 [Zobellia sp.]|nr:hypothetical protein [Zobellia sp.]
MLRTKKEVKTAFKKTVILVEDNRIEREKRDLEELPEMVFKPVKKEVEIFLGQSVIGDNLKRIIIGGPKILYSMLKSQLNLPLADNETILKLHGRSMKNANVTRNEHIHKIPEHIVENFDFSKDEMPLTEHAIEKIRAKHTYSINSERGQMVFDEINKISNSLNLLLNENVVHEETLRSIRLKLDRLTDFKILSSGKTGIKVNEKRIHTF